MAAPPPEAERADPILGWLWVGDRVQPGWEATQGDGVQPEWEATQKDELVVVGVEVHGHDEAGQGQSTNHCQAEVHGHDEVCWG